MNPERTEIFKNSIGDEEKASVPKSGPSGGGLREMEDYDVPQVTKLWERYMARFGMATVMNEDEIRHYLLSGHGEGPIRKGRREGQVVWSYVVEARLFRLPLYLLD
jgi:Myristoyl-CoA:protein N-myristoyltransferase, C-terminal domain